MPLEDPVEDAPKPSDDRGPGRPHGRATRSRRRRRTPEPKTGSASRATAEELAPTEGDGAAESGGPDGPADDRPEPTAPEAGEAAAAAPKTRRPSRRRRATPKRAGRRRRKGARGDTVAEGPTEPEEEGLRGAADGLDAPAAVAVGGEALEDEHDDDDDDDRDEEEGEDAAEAGDDEAREPPKVVEKVLLVNAADGEEVRIALLEDGVLEELYVEAAEERSASGNIYRGRVQNIEKGIGAAFVELGRGLTGFLHVSDLPERPPGATIGDLVEPGQDVLVQVTRDSVGRKGPALSGRIALAGRYLVLLARTPRSGVSRRIQRGRTRDKARRQLERLQAPEGMGLIVRTAGEGAGAGELERDLAHLVKEWERIQAEGAEPGPPRLLRAESDLAERSVRDIMPRDTRRILVDREDVAARVRELVETWHAVVEGEAGEAPAAGEGGTGRPEVVVHTDAMPLFHAHGVEAQIEQAFRRTIRLPSGGSIVIDPTEALVAVDVNSGRHTSEEDPEKTALQTNLEAVGEVARQLRLRDLGGLVVLDLIDMRSRKGDRQVERAFKKALARDRARIRLGRIGPFGCVLLSRQRIRQALSRVTHEECPECGGTGRRRHPVGLGLRVLREVQARVARARGRGGFEVRVPKAVHDWIRRHRGRLLKDLDRQCSGPLRLEVDERLAVDGWAIKGLPPEVRA